MTDLTVKHYGHSWTGSLTIFFQLFKRFDLVSDIDDGDGLMCFDCGNNKINNIYILNAYMGLGKWYMVTIYTLVFIIFNVFT